MSFGFGARRGLESQTNFAESFRRRTGLAGASEDSGGLAGVSFFGAKARSCFNRKSVSIGSSPPFAFLDSGDFSMRRGAARRRTKGANLTHPASRHDQVPAQKMRQAAPDGRVLGRFLCGLAKLVVLDRKSTRLN